MDIQEIRQLAAWLGEAQLTALELKRPGLELFIKRSQAPLAHPPSPLPLDAGEPDKTGQQHLKAPQPGLFIVHRADERNPYAQPGEQVTAGQLLGLLNIDGLYLPVRSTTAGKLIRLLAGDGERVGYGQPLFELEAC